MPLKEKKRFVCFLIHDIRGEPVTLQIFEEGKKTMLASVCHVHCKGRAAYRYYGTYLEPRTVYVDVVSRLFGDTLYIQYSHVQSFPGFLFQ